MSNTDKAHVGRRLSTWRRLMLAFGPPSAKRVALALAEFAWADQNDPDADLIARHCTQKILCRLCDYKNDRGLRAQLIVLEDSGWLKRDDMPTGPHMHREYTLLTPKTVPADAIVELTTPSSGMWKRVLWPDTERTPELIFRCSTDQPQKQEHRNPSTGTPEPQRRNTGTPAQEHRNLSSGLYKSTRSSLGDLKGGSPQSGNQKSQNQKSKKTKGLQHVSKSLPDWKDDRRAARRALNLNDDPEEKSQ